MVSESAGRSAVRLGSRPGPGMMRDAEPRGLAGLKSGLDSDSDWGFKLKFAPGQEHEARQPVSESLVRLVRLLLQH